MVVGFTTSVLHRSGGARLSPAKSCHECESIRLYPDTFRVAAEFGGIHALDARIACLVSALGRLEEIERCVLSWGEHARVLEQSELKRRIRRAAEGILATT